MFNKKCSWRNKIWGGKNFFGGHTSTCPRGCGSGGAETRENGVPILVLGVGTRSNIFFTFVCVVQMKVNTSLNTIVWSAYTQHIIMPTELCITYPEVEVFVHTKLAIVSRLLIPYWQIIYIAFDNVVYLHLTFLSDLFNCLMLFTNLHFSSIISCSCTTVTNWYSCWCAIPVYASHPVAKPAQKFGGEFGGQKFLF